MRAFDRRVSLRALEREADELVTDLARTGRRLVLAESCTGGQVAAALTTIPGVSRHFCGSLVVYRDASKSEWLDPSLSLVISRSGDVSAEVTTGLAVAALARTSEASIAGAVTGYLGPSGDPAGRVYYSVALRENPGGLSQSGAGRVVAVAKKRIQTRRAIHLPKDLKFSVESRRFSAKMGRKNLSEECVVLSATHCVIVPARDAVHARRERQLAASMTLLRMVRSLLNLSEK